MKKRLIAALLVWGSRALTVGVLTGLLDVFDGAPSAVPAARN